MTPRPMHFEPDLLLGTKESYAADALAVRHGVSSMQLMEAAGAGVAAALFDRWTRRPVVVLCGPGNNGGDGFVVARLLRQAGWPVRLALLGGAAALKADAAAVAGRWGGEIEILRPDCLAGADLAIDGIFGAGLARPVDGVVAETIARATAQQLTVLAIDIPTGIDGDTGQVLGAAFQADLTVTFVRCKPGHLLYPGRRHCGQVRVIDIGTPPSVIEEMAPRQWRNGMELWGHLYPWPKAEGHKYGRGHAVVVCGNPGMTGAARLAAQAALRSGAGLVTVMGPPASLAVNAVVFTSIMAGQFTEPAELVAFVSDRRRNTVLLGPGNGVGPQTRANVLAVLGLGKNAVLDADALSSFADRPDELFAAVRGPTVLTPHEGEFQRLFPDLPVHEGRWQRAVAAARRSRAVVVFKGADTVIAAPDGRCAINDNAPPFLATAGTGDVLAGMVAGLLAQGMPAFEAAAAAVWLHGAAARTVGLGLIADDLPAALPEVLGVLARDLGVRE